MHAQTRIHKRRHADTYTLIGILNHVTGSVLQLFVSFESIAVRDPDNPHPHKHLIFSIHTAFQGKMSVGSQMGLKNKYAQPISTTGVTSPVGTVALDVEE